jgi:hypothetical protein
MFDYLYNFIFNICKQNTLPILPINEIQQIENDSFDLSIERTVYKLLVNKITKTLTITYDDFNTIYLLPVDKKIRIIQIINRAMKNEPLMLTLSQDN